MVHNPLYPITIDILASLFEPYNLQRIVLFSTNRVCALAEFPDVASAKKAKEELDGQEIYEGEILFY
jgi:polypyrimidine tract-binding protein 2